MADLSAVLRKTIDGLPSATPQLRAKVYEKARAAVQRQITNADPPFGEDVIEARHRALEDAITQTEAHYTGGAHAASAPAPASFQAPAPAPVAPERPAFVPAPTPPAPRIEEEQRARPETPPPPAPPSFAPPSYVPRTTALDTPEPSALPRAPYAPSPAVSDDSARVSFERQAQRSEPLGNAEPRVVPAFASASTSQPLPGGGGGRAPVAPPPYGTGRVAGSPGSEDARVGEIGPVPEEGLRPTEIDDDRHEDHDDDLSAPISYRQTPPRSRRSLYVGVASLAFLGLVGGLAYVYSDELRGALTGTEVAAVDPAPATDTTPAAVTGTPSAGETPPAAVTGSARAFTQRLQADGTETDPGPAQEATNTLDEGTDVATATLIEPSQTPPVQPAAPPTETAAVAAPAETPATPAAGESAVPVGQRAVFYEERSPTSPGSQRSGNVVWSIVNEPPATGQPPEPAIRAVADVPDQSLRLTMTIRRNADETLPASHVIELMFDVPDEFAGGEIANVQRLALKPTEQARGEPLIGVAGRISDGFFIIALNDLEQAVTSNLALLRAQEWIDIPLAYSSGQRALFSLEKGIPGERVFREALDAWAARATSSAG